MGFTSNLPHTARTPRQISQSPQISDGLANAAVKYSTAFLKRDLPEGRLGSDQEVADVISFVVSERARWVNGALIPVDGAQGRPGAQWFGEA